MVYGNDTILSKEKLFCRKNPFNVCDGSNNLLVNCVDLHL